MYQASDQTPVQTGVEILRGFFNGEFDVKTSGGEDIKDIFFEASRAFATTELRDRGFNEVEITCLFEDHEAYEDLPIYNEYYRLLTVFNRKVLTATSSVI
jgi:hypothetical protein